MAYIHGIFFDFKRFIAVRGALDEVSFAHGGSQGIEETSSGDLPEWTRQTIQHLPQKNL